MACGSDREEIDLDREERAALEALGYINAVPVAPRFEGRAGVTHHDPDRSFPGLNFFNARNESVAKLLDMQGDTLKGDTYLRFQRRLPSYIPGWLGGWSFVEMLDDGGILAIGSHGAPRPRAEERP